MWPDIVTKQCYGRCTIVSLSAGFFDAFKQQHPGENVGDVLTNFMATIRSGFEKGAKEAQGILKGLELNIDIASNIDKTLAMVEEDYTRFEAAQRDSLVTANRAPSAA
jgi:hypothetical protein